MDGRGQMIGHVCGWINIDYGQPYLFNFRPRWTRATRWLPRWTCSPRSTPNIFGWANAMYEKSGQPVRVNKVRTQTMRNADALVRYLRMHGIPSVIERTTIGWEL